MLQQTPYTHFLDQVLNSSKIKMHKKFSLVRQWFASSSPSRAPFTPVAYVLDFTQRKYLHVDDSCSSLLGYSAQYFLKEGLERYLEKFHPVDSQITGSLIFDDNINFLKSIALEQYSEYIISYNYRIQCASGRFVKVVQRSSFIPSIVAGKPFGVVGIIFDVTHFKSDNTIIHTIERKCAADSIDNELVFKKIYSVPTDDFECPLSCREVELLRLMSGGLSSKQIASEIHLSINTVNNHRKNMLKKTGCKSSAELIQFAFKNGLL
jgi:DNA-binding CsgD family transcriptional regulator